MKKTYVVFMNRTGNPSDSGVQFNVQAESEFEAIQKAQKEHPDYKIASIKHK